MHDLFTARGRKSKFGTISSYLRAYVDGYNRNESDDGEYLFTDPIGDPITGAPSRPYGTPFEGSSFGSALVSIQPSSPSLLSSNVTSVSSVLPFDEPSVLSSNKPSVLSSDEPLLLPSNETTLLPSDESSVLPSDEPSLQRKNAMKRW